jgi:hypothetical protein
MNTYHVVGVTLALAASVRLSAATALDDYVSAPDPNYKWRDANQTFKCVCFQHVACLFLLDDVPASARCSPTRGGHLLTLRRCRVVTDRTLRPWHISEPLMRAAHGLNHVPYRSVPSVCVFSFNRTVTGGTAHVLNVTSQKWLDTSKAAGPYGDLWTHQVVVVVPKTLKNTDVALSYLTGNCNNNPKAPDNSIEEVSFASSPSCKQPVTSLLCPHQGSPVMVCFGELANRSPVRTRTNKATHTWCRQNMQLWAQADGHRTRAISLVTYPARTRIKSRKKLMFALTGVVFSANQSTLCCATRAFSTFPPHSDHLIELVVSTTGAAD